MRVFAHLTVSAILFHIASASSFSVVGEGAVIRDLRTTISTVNVSVPVESISSVRIFGLSHSWMGDLAIFLRDDSVPDVLYNLIDRSCLSTQLNNSDYTILEPGFASRWAGCPPPDGTYDQVLRGFPGGIDVSLGLISGAAGSWSLVIIDHVRDHDGSFGGWTLSGNSASTCDASQRAGCSPHATCSASDESVTCSCRSGFIDDSADGSVCVDIDECRDEDFARQCDVMAYCQNRVGSWSCECPEGFIGDGFSCSRDAFSIRVVAIIPGVDSYTSAQLETLKTQFAAIVTGNAKPANDSDVQTLPSAVGASVLGPKLLGVADGALAGDAITLFALYASEADARADLAQLTVPDWAAMGASSIEDGPAVYLWVGGSTSDTVQIPPTGLSVDAVFFDGGSWKVDVTYTTGADDFNVFFIPRASADDDLSYDPVYTAVDPVWAVSPADTFLPATHPCTSAGYQPTSGDLPATITACCIPEFLAMYRPVDAFGAALAAIPGLNLSASVCGTGDRARAVARAGVPWFVQRGEAPESETSFLPPLSPSVVSGVFVDGRFAGMQTSNIYHVAVLDAKVGVYRARLELDEVEVRSLAGQRRGTVGVEHTVDTFVGLVNFSPTGSRVLDTGAVQEAIHLEKTSFFSVSTHGTNDYTFLEYVNLRLVAVYDEDADVSGADIAAAHFVQVTFTLGSQYAVDTTSGLIPLDAVRAGEGVFFAEAELEHKCLQWSNATSVDDQHDFADRGTFQSRLGQSCSPATSMCSSPTAIPESFVSFSIPLGINFLDSDSLSQNVFVAMVISAIDARATGVPNEGGDPKQVKTTLTATIPVVEGGVNVFCDGITGKTDLKGVASADIVVGSASTADELSRLRTKKDIAGTQQDTAAVTEINTDSIEAGLMTLVLEGNASYFLSNGGRRDVSIELEDVITVHIMEDDGDGSDTAAAAAVDSLLSSPPSDNSDLLGLDTDSYALNGAFYFVIDRSAKRAHLEPSEDLLTICTHNPPKPLYGSVPVETCVLRRDVQYRGFPRRPGAASTAMEICSQGTCPSGAEAEVSDEASFLVTLMGDSAYARKLGVDYANVISASYGLNGRYRRAYWINPGYEWTPTQTGGAPLFSVSQKLYLLALIALDEGIATDDGRQLSSGGGPFFGRRLLLQSANDALKDGQASVGSQVFGFQTSPTQLMAKSFNVPEDRVATFKLTIQLTRVQACMELIDLQASLRTTLDEYVSMAASSFHTVLVTRMSVDHAGVECSRRAARALRSQFSDARADVTMLVVFQEGTFSTISLTTLSSMDGIRAIEPLTVSPKVNTAADETLVPTPQPKKEGGGSSSPALIAGAAGGGAAAVLVILGVVCFRQRTKEDAVNFNMEDIKVQLAFEVSAASRV